MTDVDVLYLSLDRGLDDNGAAVYVTAKLSSLACFHNAPGIWLSPFCGTFDANSNIKLIPTPTRGREGLFAQ